MQKIIFLALSGVLLLFFAGCLPNLENQQQIKQPIDSYIYCFTNDSKGNITIYRDSFSNLPVYFKNINYNTTTNSKGCVEINKSQITNVPLKVDINKRGIYEFTLEKPFMNYALIIEEIADDFWKEENLHWTHMPLTYDITNEGECGSYEANKIKRGLNEITNTTQGRVSFKKVIGNADITFSCEFIENCYNFDVNISELKITHTETICAHDRGMAQITGFEGNRILKSEITMFGLAGFSETTGKGASGFYIGSCGHPTTEIHEVLHTLGYKHVSDPNSIMYFQEDSVGYTIQQKDECIGKRKNIDSWIIGDLMDTYSR